MTWQGIESAPRDSGEHILVTKDNLIFLVYWTHGWREAWSGGSMKESFTPTHWMPLPEPPT